MDKELRVEVTGALDCRPLEATVCLVEVDMNINMLLVNNGFARNQ